MSRQRRSVVSLSATAVLYSLTPLLVRAAGGDVSIWVFAATLEATAAGLMAAALVATAPRVFGGDNLKSVLASARLVLWPPRFADSGPAPKVLLCMLASTAANMVLYLWAANLVPLVVVACIVEGTWAIPLAILAARWSGSRRRISGRAVALMCVVPVGVAAVVASQAPPGEPLSSWSRMAAGIALAFATSAMFALRPATGILYGERSVQARSHPGRRPPIVQTLWWTMLATAATGAPGAVASVPMLVVGGTAVLRSAVAGAAAGVLAAAGQMTLRAGNIAAVDTSVNSIMYATPLLSVLWLWAAGDTIHRLPLLIVGAVMVMAGNAAVAVSR